MSTDLSSTSSLALSKLSSLDTIEQSLELKHGILLDYQCRVCAHIKSVIFQASSQSTVVHHSVGFAVYLRDKLQKTVDSADLAKRVDRLHYNETHNASECVYVGVCSEALLLINKEFQCVYECCTKATIIYAVLNLWNGDIVTCGQGNITTYMFKHEGKVLFPAHVISEGMPASQEVSFIHIEDVPGKAQRCFSVLETGVKVHLMNSGKLLASLDKLHSRSISALTFFRPLRLLITGATDGTIKVWDSNWELVCSFVGHTGVVTGLTAYPQGPMLLSGARDGSIRVWNLATHDQVEILSHTTPVEGVISQPGVPHLLSYSGRQLKGWRIRELYHQSALTGPVSSLIATTHPLVPLRVVAGCADSAVRVVSPVRGEVITTALLSVGKKIVTMAYFSVKEVLHVLDGDGVVWVYNTLHNPATLLTSWSAPQHLNIGDYSCLLLYEVASDSEDIDEALAADKWLSVMLEARQLSRVAMSLAHPLDQRREGSSHLLAGTDQGWLTMVDSDGRVQYSTQSPSGSIILMSADPRHSQVITAGQDGGLDVWQLHLHTIEPLSHILTFSLPTSTPPSVLLVTKERLCVATNDSEHANYSLDMFDLTERVSYSSVPESSHTDTICYLDCSPRLHVVASTSLDCTVRLWTEDNRPIRLLTVESPPTGLAFCSPQGHLMIALYSHLHIIDNTTYFNESLKKQLLSLRFPEAVAEPVRQWSVSLSSLCQEDRSRLELIDNTISQNDYHGALSEEEVAALEEAVCEKTLCLQSLAAREQEIKDIRDGHIRASKKTGHPPLKGREKKAFWRELLAVIRAGDHQLDSSIFQHTNINPDDKQQPQPTPEASYTKPPRYKFFPPLATFDPPYPLAPDGYLPNSVLLHGLRKTAADQEMVQGWQPPVLSGRQRKFLQKRNKLKEDTEEIDDSESRNKELMSRLQAALSAAPHSPTPSPSPPPTPSPPSSPHKKILSPNKPIQKLIAPKPPPPKSPTPTPPRTPTPPPRSPTPPPPTPPPPTPLPEYIAQFIGQSWFDKLFPNATSKTFPKPWSVSKFVFSLLNCLRMPLDSLTKADICSALLKLVLEHSPGNKSEIYSTVLSLLTTPPCPTPQNMAERHFILAALKLLFQLSVFDTKLAVLLMTHYVLGDSELRRVVGNQLQSKGLVDPEGYFDRLLVSVDSESVSGVEGVMTWSKGWLNEWAEQLSASNGTKLLKAPMPAKRSLRSTAAPKKRSKVTFSNTAVSSAPSFDAIAIINHYVSAEHMVHNRVATPPPAPPPVQPEDELPHNTVVALPKINRHSGLIRLGETHCSCCHPDRESSLALLHRVPCHYNTPQPGDPTKLWRHFTHCLTLALRPQNINPFLSQEEREAEEEMQEHMRTQRLSVQSMVKYFIPERTYVNSET